jgi:hypothetical protein
VTGPVRPPTRADQAWAEFAAELTPAKSLARVDTVTARAVTTITVVGVVLTGLGALAAGLPAQNTAARDLAVATVITAAAAVACALSAQILTITRHLNPGNMIEVKAWYRRQFNARAYPTQAATILLLLAALLAGATAATVLTAGQPVTPAIAVTQTLPPVGSASPATSASAGQVTVTATFRGLAPGQAVTVTLATVGRVLTRAIATPAPDGTATITLTAAHLTAGQPVTLTTRGRGQACQATLPPGPGQPALNCHPR